MILIPVLEDKPVVKLFLLLSVGAGGPLHLGDEAGLYGGALLVTSLVYDGPAHDVAYYERLAAPQHQSDQRVVDLHISRRLIFNYCVEDISYRHFLT